MHIADPLGVPGAPTETLEAFKQRFQESDLTGAHFTLITDSQDHRDSARYAALITFTGEAVITAPAFGPRYGEEGLRCLRELAHWARAQNLEPVSETVLNPSDFVRVLDSPQPQDIAQLRAAANPSDLGIYLK